MVSPAAVLLGASYKPQVLVSSQLGAVAAAVSELEARSFLKILPRATVTAVKMMTRSWDVISSFISIFPQEREKLR